MKDKPGYVEAHDNLTMVSTTGVMFVPKKWICVTHVAPALRDSASRMTRVVQK
jgi:hypothetical protein